MSFPFVLVVLVLWQSRFVDPPDFSSQSSFPCADKDRELKNMRVSFPESPTPEMEIDGEGVKSSLDRDSKKEFWGPLRIRFGQNLPLPEFLDF